MQHLCARAHHKLITWISSELSPLHALGMASSLSRKCEQCSASYACLYDLVSHVRAAHSLENSLGFVCRVDGCLSVFNKTNTWYKHVVQSHKEEYYKRSTTNIPEPEPEPESEHEDEDDNDFDGFIEDPIEEFDEGDTHTHSLDLKVYAGRLIQIQEKHLVTRTVVNEIVDLVEMACEDVSSQTFSAIVDLGEVYDMDLTSPFFQELPAIFEGIRSPLKLVRTAYKQQSFIAKNLPYVVCFNNIQLAIDKKFFFAIIEIGLA